MKNKLYSFKAHLKESLTTSEFKKEWQKSKAEYKLACELIERRLHQKLSQRDLAKKTQTSQSVISNIETMQGNPSLSLLKRIATALNTSVDIRFH